MDYSLTNITDADLLGLYNNLKSYPTTRMYEDVKIEMDRRGLVPSTTLTWSEWFYSWRK